MEKYEFMSRTGEGAYGSVWRARDKNTGILVAVKKMKDVPTTEEEGEIAMREVRVLQLAKHVNIVNLLEAYKSQSGRLYLVFEYVERTLLQELKANRMGMPPAAVKSITWQLLQALGYLHRKQIIHRDVKPSNILITEGGVVKICDFGFARACGNEAVDPAYTTYVVTRWYRPPEVLVGDTYGPPVDIWALGCIFAEMLLGRPLFPGKNHHDQLWLILKCLGAMTERQLDLLDADAQFACFRLPTQSEIEPLEARLGSFGPAAMQVLRACLDPDPKQRATAEELLAMPYFNGITESLPMDELAAYPDPEMRAKLDRALAQDQANAAAAAAAAARESMLLVQPTRRLGSKLSPPHQPGALVLTTAAGNSPARLALQQLQQQQHPHQHPGGGLPLPTKAATASKLDPAVSGAESQRPPLQRFITAPAASLASRVGCGQQLAPLQPLAEPSGQQQHQQSHLLPQRSREGSQANSPKGGMLIPARGRSSWRVSNDGSCDGAGMGPVGVRQLPVGNAVRPPPQATAATTTAANGGLATAAAAAASSAGSGGSHAPTSMLFEGSRVVPDQPVPTTQRPAYQRATWNGSSAPRSNGGGASSGGGGGPSTGGAPPGGGFLGSSCASTQGSAHDTITLHRKAHSLAGNELLLPASTAQPMGVVRNVSGLGALGGVQGRGLAPPLAQVLSGSSAPAGNGVAVPANVQLVIPTIGPTGRMSVSPPPLAYGSLRGTNSMPLGPITSVGSAGRGNNDGGVSVFNAAASLSAQNSAGPSGRLQPQLYGPASLTVQALPPSFNSELMAMPELEGEGSEGSLADGVEPPSQNQGRRASDTVLYAATALREGKARAERPPPHTFMGVGRQHHSGLLEGTGAGAPAGGNGSGGGASGLGALRNGSFRTGAMGHPGANAPTSPDGGGGGLVCANNLPPLQLTPHRRVSAPEAAAMAVLSGGASNGGATVRGAQTQTHNGAMHTGGGGASGAAHSQRHRQPHGQHCHPSAFLGHAAAAQGNGHAAGDKGGGGQQCSSRADGGDVGEVTGTNCVLLPSLDAGQLPGKAVRVSSAGTGTAMGVARRPSKGAAMRVYGPDVHCKREDTSKILLLEAVPEASVL